MTLKSTTEIPTTPYRKNEFYAALPKVELHRHLEGSLRLNTLVEVARTYGLKMLGTGRLRALVQMNEEEPFTFENFLSKFQTLRLFYRSPEIIARIAREAIEDAALDNVRYLELRFSPSALSKAQDFALEDVMNWVLDSARQASADFGITTRLIVSVNRHESAKLAETVVQLAADHLQDGVVAVDLAGNEAEFSALPFKEIFRSGRQAGLQVCIHAGEWGGADNIAEAIVDMGASRIGHGVRVLEDPSVTGLAREFCIPFEVCVTSNYQSGVVNELKSHPLQDMIAAGLNVTINTDDPSISQIKLSDEYRLACEELGLAGEELRARVLAGAQAAFLPEQERQALAQTILAEFPESWI